MYATAAVAHLSQNLTSAVAAARAPLLFAIRLWASVCLALFVAFWLQLDNPFWAGGSAAIVCQPQLGASLRKSWFRILGTVVGATVIVVLTAFFPQDRIAFLGLLAAWGALCAFGATVLPNFASYSAALAGYTRRSSLLTTSARPEEPIQMSSCWRSRERARSASGSSALASSWQRRTSAAPSGGSQRHSPVWRPRSPADLPACWH
jgi:hypothetical protein